MTPERWRLINEIFEEALEQPAGQRTKLLHLACGDDEDLRQEVESLLAYDSPCGVSIQQVIQEEASLLVDSQRREPLGRRIGPYRLIRELGQGGMGTVYLAARADDQFEQSVALKVVNRGLESEAMRNRFREERRLLAQLQHPNIARLLDGGTTPDGLPYFTMEYLDGKPISDYCADHNLSVPDRLRLFQQVCSAVQYAHRKLIVHRDLKPSNILVTPEGSVKLLDFGIAKLLQGTGEARTIVSQSMLTPHYASPEQLRGEEVSTGTDVYSLGAVLYQLLTGSRLFATTDPNPLDLLRAIETTEPRRPSLVVKALATHDKAAARLARELSGDLDNITLVATRKEPERRYPSVEALSEDIGRYLEGRPVVARPANWRYSTRKFLGRNKLAVSAAVLLGLVLAGAGGLVVHQKRIAEQRFDQLRHLANSFLFEFHDSIADLPGSTKARALVVQKAQEYLDALAKESGNDPSLQRELGEAYIKVGQVQGGPGKANLGDSAGAMRSARRAMAILEPLAAAHPQDRSTVMALAEAESLVGRLLRYGGDPQQARLILEGAASRIEALSQNAPQDTKILFFLASLYDHLAVTYGNVGTGGGRLETSKKALAIYERLSAIDPGNQTWRTELGGSYNQVGSALIWEARLDEALTYFRTGLRIYQEMAKAAPENAAIQRQLIIGYSHVGDTLGNPELPNLGDYARAVQYFRPMLGIAERLAKADSANQNATQDLAMSLGRMGSTLAELPEPNASAEYLDHSLAIQKQVVAKDPHDRWALRTLFDLQARMGKIASHAGRFPEAEQHLLRAQEIGVQLCPNDKCDNRILRLIALNEATLARCEAALNHRSKALAVVTRSLDLTERFQKQPPASFLAWSDQITTLALAGETYCELGLHSRQEQDSRTGRDLLTRAQAIWDKQNQAKAKGINVPSVQAASRNASALVAKYQYK